MVQSQKMKALDSSIRRWKKKLNIVKSKIGIIPIPDKYGYILEDKKISIGHRSCPLCELYYKGGDSECNGCPISKHSGIEDCQGTPYEEVVFWLLEVSGRAAINEHVVKAFENEVKFLGDLMLKLKGEQSTRRSKNKLKRAKKNVSTETR